MKSSPIILIRNLYKIVDQSWFGMSLHLHIGASDPTGNLNYASRKATLLVQAIQVEIVMSHLQRWRILTSSLILLFSMHESISIRSGRIIIGLEYRLQCTDCYICLVRIVV